MAALTLDLTNALLAYERGELDTFEFLELFAELVGTGQAWELQGSYERIATDLIEGGYITPAGTIAEVVYEAVSVPSDKRAPLHPP
jgi:hypothetical protein